jgi:hypothetical protein
MVVSAISGLVDVNAISLTLAGFVNNGTSAVRAAVIGMTLAAGVNAIFKSGVAQTSHQPAFYLRLIAGFVIMFAVGTAAIWLLDPARVAELASHLQTELTIDGIKGGRRMHEIKSFKIFQTAKVIAALYALLGLVEGVILVILSLRHPQHHLRVAVFLAIGAPILFAVFGFIFMVIICWLYNLVAARIGGIAFELTPRSES